MRAWGIALSRRITLRVVQRLPKAIDAASGVYCFIGMAAVFIFAFLLSFEAIARFFGFTTLWIHWGSIVVIATISFFTAAYAMREFLHVRVSIFENLMPPRTRVYSQLFGYSIFLITNLVALLHLRLGDVSPLPPNSEGNANRCGAPSNRAGGR